MIWKHSTPTKGTFGFEEYRAFTQGRAFRKRLASQACDCAHKAADERLLYVSISQLAKRPHIARVTRGKWEKRVTRCNIFMEVWT